jgi:hypothetical protein
MKKHEHVGCRMCWHNMRGWGHHKGHAFYRKPRPAYQPPIWERIEAMKARQKASGGVTGAPAKGFMHLYPQLWEMMTADAYEDGRRRRRSSILMMMDGGIAKLLVMDKDLNEQCWIAAESPDECFEKFETGMETNSLQWMPSQGKPEKRSR